MEEGYAGPSMGAKPFLPFEVRGKIRRFLRRGSWAG